MLSNNFVFIELSNRCKKVKSEVYIVIKVHCRAYSRICNSTKLVQNIVHALGKELSSLKK